MKKYRHRADGNQNEIVAALRQIPGMKVEKGHDDIIVGYRGKTFWYEIKKDEKAKLKPSQIKLKAEWTGHYEIVWTLEQILNDVGIF